VRLQQSLEHDLVSGTQLQRPPKHIERIVESTFDQQMLACFDESGGSFCLHAYFEIAFSQLDPQIDILRIEIRYLAQHSRAS